MLLRSSLIELGKPWIHGMGFVYRDCGRFFFFEEGFVWMDSFAVYRGGVMDSKLTVCRIYETCDLCRLFLWEAGNRDIGCACMRRTNAKHYGYRIPESQTLGQDEKGTPFSSPVHASHAFPMFNGP